MQPASKHNVLSFDGMLDGNKNTQVTYSNVVFGSRMIEFSQAPINQPQLPLLMINHHVMRLDVSVHDTV